MLNNEQLADSRPAAAGMDERYAITQAEKDEVLNRYFGPDNKLLIHDFPVKEKKKIIIMQKLIDDFEADKQYAEKEVNEILKQYYNDFVSVRRHLIEYGFMDRNADGTYYWVRLL